MQKKKLSIIFLLVISLSLSSFSLPPLFINAASISTEEETSMEITTQPSSIEEETSSSEYTDLPPFESETSESPSETIESEDNSFSLSSNEVSVSSNSISQNKLFVETYALGNHDINYTPGKSAMNSRLRQSLPSSYDARNANVITSPKNQFPYGTCWSFASISAAESSLLSRDTSFDYTLLDLSERHLAYFLYNNNIVKDPLGNCIGDKTSPSDISSLYNVGGNAYLACMGLSNWVGVADEKVAPYKDIPLSSDSLNSNLAFMDIAHLQNAYFYNDTDINGIKQKIISSGSVAVSYNTDYVYYNESDSTYYYCPKEKATNHAVTIIGWDDAMDKNKFITFDGTLPAQNGAWLVKNNWGTSWGDNGYFWISYEDQTLTSFIGVDYEPASNYDHNYFYDGSASVIGLPIANGSKISNQFTVKSDAIETLKAVSLTILSTDINYDIQIYKNPLDKSNPSSGTKLLETSITGTFTNEGYYTIPLPAPIFLKRGDTFAVIITLTNANGSTKTIYPAMDMSYNYGWISFSTTEFPNQSFLQYPNSQEWLDLSQSDSTARMKAFTDKTDWTLETNNVELIYNVNEPSNFTPVITSDGSQLPLELFSWTSSNTSIATVKNGIITPKGIGSCKITLKDASNKAASFNVSVNPHINSCKISISSCEYTGEPVTPKITVTSGSKTLIKGTDYTVSFSDNVDAGNANVTITGSENYPGTITKNFAIIPKAISSAKFTLPNDYTPIYTGEPIEMDFTLEVNGTTIIKDKDYTCVYSNNINKGKNAVITIKGIGNYKGTTTKTFEIFPQIIGALINHVEENVTYTGSPVLPDIDFETYAGKPLIKGRDYTISVTSNINVGTHVLNIKGINNFTAISTKTFEIIPFNLSDASLTLNKDSYEYTGSPLTPVPTVKAGSKTLKSGVDYTIAYENNIETGSGKVIITGKGNYSGKQEKVFFILPKPISRASFALEQTKYLNCSKEELNAGISPDIIIKDKSNKSLPNGLLIENIHYIKEYRNNTETGIAVVVITGVGNYNLHKEVTYTIEGKNIASVPFERIPSQVFEVNKDGIPLALTPLITVKDTFANPPVLDTDFTVLYRNNNLAGTASAYIIGKGDYSGCKILTFPIEKIKMGSNILIDDIDDITYTKDSITPLVSIRNELADGNKVLLIKDTDYTLSYKNNTSCSTSARKGEVIIKGKGNYTGTLQKSFEILPKDISNDISVSTPQLIYTGKELSPKPVVTFTTSLGKKVILRKNIDYTIDSNSFSDNIGSATKSTVCSYTIIGKGNYTGEYTCQFDIVPKVPSTLRVTYPSSAFYSGEAITFDYNADTVQEGIRVYLGSQLLEEAVDYEITFSNNTNAGKAYFTVTGIGNKFYGFKTYAFTIKPKPINASYLASIKDVYYSGNKAIPSLELSDNTTLLVKDTDYSISTSYVNVGNASATIKGKGNYSGSFSVKYKILPINMSEDYLEFSFVEGGTYKYTGKKLSPKIEVFYKPDGLNTPAEDYILLKEKAAYTLKYYNNTNVGIGDVLNKTGPYVEIKRVGSKNWIGIPSAFQKAFSISKESLRNGTILQINDQTFKGYSISPQLKVKVGGNYLKKGLDYDILSYINNRKRGKATVMIMGKGNYDGMIQSSFYIK